MLRYIIRRLGGMIPLLVVITSATFILGQYGAGDLAAYLTLRQNGGQMNMGAYLAMRKQLHLDDPVFVRYGRWLWDAVHGNLGVAYATPGQPDVSYLIGRALPISLQLGLAALVLVILVGIPLGILAAVFRNRLPDYLIVGGATLTSSIPSFVLAPIAMIVFVAQLHIIPTVGLGWQGLFSTNIILPAITLAAGPILGVVRYMRASVVEVLSQEYIRAARARGLPERQVIVGHVVRNAFTPLLTVLGLTAAGLVSGSLFVETIFNIPGLGALAGMALTGGDVVMSTGVLLVSALIIMLANLLVDLGYSMVDPRVQLGR